MCLALKHNHNPNILISVITPAYNAERFIEAAIKSVLDQTYTHWEMIIVDDHSNDSTVSIVKQYVEKDARIQLIELKENKGAGNARNTAMKQAKGRFLAFLDSDDLWLPNKLETQLNHMLRNDIGFSYTKYSLIDENGNDSGASYAIPEKLEYKDLLKFCHIGCLTVMLDRNITGNVEMNEIRNRQDYILWLDITKRGIPACGLNLTLSKYRKVSNSISSNKLKVSKLNWKVYREIIGLNVLKSAWYFGHYVYFYIKKIMQQRKK